jgi:Holliday junction resolvasome RuvABC endonuclease subunit
LIALGGDPASVVSGIAIADCSDGEVKLAETIDLPSVRPTRKTEDGSKIEDHTSRAANLLLLADTIDEIAAPFDVELVVVERVSMTRGTHTMRMLAYHEVPFMLFAANRGLPLYMVQATKARRIVLGKGNLAKDKACKLLIEQRKDLRELVGDIDDDDTAGDRADAIMCALSACYLHEESENA